MPRQQARSYCFTLNNYVEADIARLRQVGSEVSYLVFGREVGDSGTPHLQGYVVFNRRVAFSTAKRTIGDRAHLEVTRGSPVQASEYCKKDGQFEEFGTLPEQGKRTDWDAFKEWVNGLGYCPSRREIILEWPSLASRALRFCCEYAEALAQPARLVDSEPRFGWQANLKAELDADPHGRKIHFIVDESGNSGKSWFCRYALSTWPDVCQVLRIGKVADLAYSVKVESKMFLIDVPRSQSQFLQYSVLESLKDRMIFSPKYESSFKIMRFVPHVIVFMNEEPDMSVLSVDRYKVTRI